MFKTIIIYNNKSPSIQQLVIRCEHILNTVHSAITSSFFGSEEKVVCPVKNCYPTEKSRPPTKNLHIDAQPGKPIANILSYATRGWSWTKWKPWIKTSEKNIH